MSRKITEVEFVLPMKIAGEVTSVYTLTRYPHISFEEDAVGVSTHGPNGSRDRFPWAAIARVRDDDAAPTTPSTPKAKAHAA